MIFNELRKQNANWYTASPLSHMSQEELEKTAQRAGVSVQDLLILYIDL